ncbi:unnamed protein product [Sphagnum balticum]
MAGDEKHTRTQTKCASRNARNGRTSELGRERGPDGRPLVLAPGFGPSQGKFESTRAKLKGLEHWALDFLYPYGPEHEAWRHEDLDYLCSKGLKT